MEPRCFVQKGTAAQGGLKPICNKNTTIVTRRSVFMPQSHGFKQESIPSGVFAAAFLDNEIKKCKLMVT
jgi:hypothetical protein